MFPLWRRGLAALALSLFAFAVLAGFAGQKERLLFRSQSADVYPARDAQEGLIVAAEPFDTRELQKAVFGKHDLRKAGILPLLVVITNNSDKAVLLDNLSVQLVTATRQKLDPTPAYDVARVLRGGRRPEPAGNRSPSPFPRIPGRGRPDEPIEVQVHEFAVRMAPPHSTVSGFFYFDAGRGRDLVAGSKVFITGLNWAHNGQALMYFEISLDQALRARGAPK